MNGQFEWSDGGTLLLKMIDTIIERSGGVDKMADIVIMESPEYFSTEEVNAARRRLKAIEIKTILVKKSTAFEKPKPFIDRKSTEYFSQFRPKVYNKEFTQIWPLRPEVRL